MHVGCAIVLMLVLLTRPVPTLRVNRHSSMVMPATLSIVPGAYTPSPAVRSVDPIERAVLRPASRPSEAPHPLSARSVRRHRQRRRLPAASGRRRSMHLPTSRPKQATRLERKGTRVASQGVSSAALPAG